MICKKKPWIVNNTHDAHLGQEHGRGDASAPGKILLSVRWQVKEMIYSDQTLWTLELHSVS